MATVNLPLSRAEALALDAGDVLAPLRHEFLLPEGVVYLDGNSLGPLTRRAAERVAEVVSAEWGRGLIRSWNLHGWIDLPRRVGDAIAPLIGAAPGEVVVADSTSVNLFKLLSGALALRPGRRVILSEEENFPSDLYMAQGLAALLGGEVRLRLVPRWELPAALDHQVAVVLLTHVDFRTGEMHDMAAVSEAAHRAGALALWDLAHSAGAVPVDLAGSGADFAVGCGYKYLNGGPGAPSFLWVPRRLQSQARSPLWGWLGHAEPFAFDTAYRPAAGIEGWQCGTPGILGLVSLECGVAVLAAAGMASLRRKSLALSELLLGLAERDCRGFGLALASPRDGDRRGSQVSFRHREAYAVCQALIARGVIGDFRAPDLVRFGLCPAFLTFADIWDAVGHLREVLATGAWNRQEFRVREVVT